MSSGAFKSVPRVINIAILSVQIFVKVIFLKMRFLDNDTADHFEFNDSWQQNTSTLWIHCPLWCVISKKISGPVGHRAISLRPAVTPGYLCFRVKTKLEVRTVICLCCLSFALGRERNKNKCLNRI